VVAGEVGSRVYVTNWVEVQGWIQYHHLKVKVRTNNVKRILIWSKVEKVGNLSWNFQVVSGMGNF
jgi:hypothetical protein